MQSRAIIKGSIIFLDKNYGVASAALKSLLGQLLCFLIRSPDRTQKTLNAVFLYIWHANGPYNRYWLEKHQVGSSF